MKMFQRRNLLENIIILSNCGTLICIMLHYLTDISLISGIWFLMYIVAVFIVSVFFSFRVIQWLLRLNKPLVYDPNALVENYPYLACVKGFLPELPKRSDSEWKEYDTNELSVISTVLERKLVSSWYVPYISEEISFPFACKQMLDQMIGKAFQICSNIETKDIFVDTCTILTLHSKEYEKAVKRQEKSLTNSIESLYKKTHAISQTDQKYSSVEHCTNILRIVIKELLPWELRDTPHSELLVRILSKKLDSYIDSTLANPAWLNDMLMTYLTGEEYVELKTEEIKKEVINVDESLPKNTEISTEDVNHKNTEISTEDVNHKNDVVLEESQEKTETVIQPLDGKNTTDLKDLKSSPVLRQKRGRQGRNEVKIYDRIIEGSVKTWETDMDLQCISLGQDLLASLDGEITLSRLWGHEEGSPELGAKSPHLWAGEEEALELDLPSFSSPSSQTLQIAPSSDCSRNTTNGTYGSIHKPSHAPSQTSPSQSPMNPGTHSSPSQDSINPGTHSSPSQGPINPGTHSSPSQSSINPGTHSSSSQGSINPGAHSSPSQGPINPGTHSSPRQGPINPGTHSSPSLASSGHGAPRPPHSPAADAILKDLQTTVSQAKTKIGDLQVKGIHVSNGASDEAAGMMEGLLDLGIAGLKKGLRFTGLGDDAQEKCAPHTRDKSVDKSPPAEGGSRQRDAPHQAVEALMMKEDCAGCVPPLVKQQRVTSQDSVGRGVPIPPDSPEPQYEEAADLSTSIAKLRRLLRQRADTQPGGGEEVWWEVAEETLGRTQQHSSSRPVDTAALADEYDMSLERNSPNQTSNNMQRLFQRTVTGVFNSLKTAVGGDEPDTSHAQPWAYVQTNNELSVCVVAARLAWSRRARGVEAALDSLHLHRPPPPAPPTPEDLEEWLAVRGRAWCAASAAARALRSHVAHRLASLLLAEIAESLITCWLEGLAQWLRDQTFLAFSKMEEGSDVRVRTARPLSADHTCHTIMDRMPVVKAIFGEETVSSAVQHTVSSLSHADLNRDVAFRVVDLLAWHFRRAAAAPHPASHST